MVFEKLFNPPKKGKKKEKKKAGKINEDYEGWVRCKTVIEILGAPKEHVEETMKAYMQKLKEEKDYKIVDEYLSEAEPKNNLFAQFAELELVFKKPANIIDFCFDYMPSSIEIVAPEDLVMKSFDLSGILNDLQARLHKLDMLVKNMSAENKILSDNTVALLRNNIMISLKEKEKKLAELAKNIGLEEEITKKFLEQLINQDFVKLKKGKYSLKKAPPKLIRKPVKNLTK